jgi:hypothetical protein
VAREAVDWMVANFEECAGSREVAVAIGKHLQDVDCWSHVTDPLKEFEDGHLFFRFRQHGTGAQGGINEIETAGTPPPSRPVSELAAELRDQSTQLKVQFIDTDTMKVDYDALRTSSTFSCFVGLTAELRSIAWDDLADPAMKMSFFINVYNFLVVHASALFGVPQTTWARMKFFSGAAYSIGGHVLSLQDIENGILRSNRASPVSFFSSTHFRASDPRAALCLDKCDPRLHFALNCGASSCPPVRVYHPETLDADLESSTQAFLRDDIEVDLTKKRIHCSRIIKWYGIDFGKNDKERIAWISKYLPRGVIPDEGKGYKLCYKVYNWGH